MTGRRRWEAETVRLLLPIHIAAAALGLIAGTVALAVAKGGGLHRRSGLVFVYAIVAMCGAAVAIAVLKGQTINVIAGLMTSYLAMTAMITVRPPVAASRTRDLALMVMAFVLGLTTMTAGLAAVVNPSSTLFGLPPFPPGLFLFGVLGLSGAAGDFKMMRSGVLRGAPRLSRHVWRMSMALWITVISFFSIRARVAAILPAMFTTPVMRALPPVLVLAAMFYWLWKVRFRRSFSARWPSTVIGQSSTIALHSTPTR
jgi:uncharacterized membrane protein